MASTAIFITPQDPASYRATSMGGTAVAGLPAGFTNAPFTNARDAILIGSTGHPIVPPISGSNNLIARKVF